MKIKLDHVTNSSSSGFILSLSKDEGDSFQEYMAELNEHEDAQNEGVRIYMFAESIIELDEYTNDGPIDWAQKPTGPHFNIMTKEHYEMCKDIINEGGIAAEVWVDHNISEKFDDDYGEKIVDNFM